MPRAFESFAKTALLILLLCADDCFQGYHTAKVIRSKFRARRKSLHVRNAPKPDSKSEHWSLSRRAMYGRRPRCKRKSDVSAKRSGAAMYPACFRLEACLCRDAAAVAAGPDVIR